MPSNLRDTANYLNWWWEKPNPLNAYFDTWANPSVRNSLTNKNDNIHKNVVQ